MTILIGINAFLILFLALIWSTDGLGKTLLKLFLIILGIANSLAFLQITNIITDIKLI